MKVLQSDIIILLFKELVNNSMCFQYDLHLINKIKNKINQSITTTELNNSDHNYLVIRYT